MQFQRFMANKVLHLASQFPAVVVTGARQAGKTTLLRSLLPHYHYVSLDLPSAAELAETNPDQFLSLHPPPIICRTPHPSERDHTRIIDIHDVPGIFSE